jgi:RNA-binding protein
MTLTGKQRNHLRRLAHHRRPVVILGAAGVTEAVVQELDAALAHHELIKVRLPAGARDLRGRWIGALCSGTGAECVQEIGRIAVLYRPAAKPRIDLPR